MHESHPRGITLPRMYDNSRKSPNFKSDFDRLSPFNLKTMAAPDFSKNWTIVLNFHAKIINTLIPVCQQTTKNWYVKRSCSTKYIFTTQHDFQICFDKKMLTCNWRLQQSTGLIYAPKKIVWFSWWAQKKVEKRQTSWSTQKLQPCPPLLQGFDKTLTPGQLTP